MGLLIRERSDGRRSAGYLVYLMAGLGATAALLLLHHRVVGGSGGAPAGRQARIRASNVAPITQSAAVMAQVDVAGGRDDAGARSYRMGASPGSSAGEDGESEVKAGAAAIGEAPAEAQAQTGGAAKGGNFDAIDQALAAPAEEEDSAGTGYAALAPAFSMGGRAYNQNAAAKPLEGGAAGLPDAYDAARDAGANGRSSYERALAAPEASEGPSAPPISVGELWDYRDETADASESGKSEDGSRGPEVFAPRGALIHVFLLTTVDTGNPAAVVQFAAARPLFFNHRSQLPFGVRFLGRLSGEPARDRLNMAVDTVLYPDGLEAPINASAVEADDTGANIWPGVAAVYYPPPLWVQAAPYVSDAFTGAMGLLESRAQQQYSLGIGGLSVQTSSGGDVKGPLYQATGQAMQDFTAAQLKEVERRYASHYLIPAGTACWLQLNSDWRRR